LRTYQPPNGRFAPYQPYWYGDPYSPYFYDPNQAYLRAGADAINTQGRLPVNQQQAHQLREQVRSAKLDNRRKAFDAYLYERQRTPTMEEERQRFLRQQLERSRNDPPLTEVWSGQALNTLLADLRQQLGRAADARLRTFEITLDEDVLKRINLTSGTGSGSLGILRNGGRLGWPVALSDHEFKDDRDRIGSLAEEAVRQAQLNNRVDAGSLQELNAGVARVQRELKRRGGDLPFNQYRDAKAFLNSLGDAVRALRQPDVGNHFTGKYTLKAGTVGELVQFMADRGLQFAPAVPGDEAAYLALHHALAGYGRVVARQALAAR
jgi:hypothetical protein